MTYVSLGILKRSQGKPEEAETLSLKALNKVYRRSYSRRLPNVQLISAVRPSFE